MAKAPPRQAFRKLVLRTLSGVAQAPFPGFVEPMHPTQHSKLPAGARWQYEIKLDGWRGQLHLRNGAAKMFSRNGNDLTAQCATLVAAAAEMQATSAVLDGEIVVPGENGIPNFLELRSAMTRGQSRLLFYAFDLLHLDGFDLRAAPLADRRSVLKQLLANEPGGRILMSETIILDEPPALLFHHACELGMEGIVAKRADAPYRSGRVASWVKVKCIRRLALPIIGYVPQKGNSIAAIRLGRHDGRELVYAGKAGTGFTVKSAQNVRDRLAPLHRKTPPLAKPLKRPDTIWVEPKVIADIAFTELTEDGVLRHASFKGLKE
jgi:bifunctional non-homologous end joining protein LigD